MSTRSNHLNIEELASLRDRAIEKLAEKVAARHAVALRYGDPSNHALKPKWKDSRSTAVGEEIAGCSSGSKAKEARREEERLG